MLGPLRHTIIKEFLTLIRDPASRKALLAAPLIQLLVFTFAATLEVKNINIAVVRDDNGHWSEELLNRVEMASFVDSIIVLPSTSGVDELIDRREVLLAMHFPSDFSRRIDAGEPAPVQLTFDGRRANAGQVTFSYVQGIAAELQMELMADGPAVPEAVVRNWFNPNLEYRWFILPALVATLALIPTILMSTLSVSREREMGTFDQLVVSPVTTVEIILGKLLPAVFAGMFSGTLITILAMNVFGLAFNGSMPWMFLGMLVFVFAVAGIGLFISSVCNTQQQAFMGTFSLVSPLMITSGFISPVTNMPIYLQYFAELNPLKHFLEIVLGSFLKNMTSAEMFASIWPMALIGLFTLSMAALTVRRSVQ